MKFNAFDLQRFAVTLPDAPTTSQATVGKDYLLFVATGSSYESPTWVFVGGQRGASLSRSADEIDVSCKSTGSWKDTIPGLKSWSIDLSGLVLLNDDGLDALETAFDLGKKVFLKFQYPNKCYRTGWASITDFSMDNDHDAEASLSGTLSGGGALSGLTPEISPLTATMSLAAAADKVFTILPATTTVSSVKNGATALTVTTDYTYSAGTLTILSGYLDGLTAGAYTFTVTTGDGAALTVTITITA